MCVGRRGLICLTSLQSCCPSTGEQGRWDREDNGSPVNGGYTGVVYRIDSGSSRGGGRAGDYRGGLR